MRRKFCNFCVLVPLFFLFNACSFLEKATSHAFEDGIYHLSVPGQAERRVYVLVEEDTLELFGVQKNGQPDANQILSGLLPGDRLRKASMDLDLTTAFFKLRPEQHQVPWQLNSNLNAAMYAGFRQDYFSLSRIERPLRPPVSTFRHFGFDAGLFLGIGSAPMTGSTTLTPIPYDYDGIIFQMGAAAYAGIGNLGIGLGLGFDSLLDSNRKNWIYHQKPWFGLFVGLGIF